MSKRSINYKRNRKKPKKSSPGGTPGPVGRIQQQRDFSDIAKEINKLKRTNRLLKSYKKEINEPMEMILPSKLLQDNLNEQSQSKIHSVASFMQQQNENVVKWHETTDVTKTDQLSSNDENTTIINLSVKQRAQMFETALSHANESINVRKFANKLDNCSEESFIQRKKRRAGTPIPNYRKTFSKISLS